MTKLNPPRSTLVLMPLGDARQASFDTHHMLSAVRDLFKAEGVKYAEFDLSGGDKHECRAELLAYWYTQTDFEDAIFLDSDVWCDARYIVNDLAKIKEPLICVPYLKRGDPSGRLGSWALDSGGEAFTTETREGRVMSKISGGGLGLTRIRRGAADMLFRHFGDSPWWVSHRPGIEGLQALGLFESIVHEHPKGSGVPRRRPEDMSFFLRCIEAGVQPYALCSIPVFHGSQGGQSYLDALKDEERRITSIKKHVHRELAECPDDLIEGLQEVLDGIYDIPGLKFRSPPRVIDCGANVGAFGVWVRNRFEGAKVVGYEPHPRMCEIASLNLNVQDTDVTVQVHQVAVVGKLRAIESRTIKLNDPIPGMNQGIRSILKSPAHAETFTEVPVLSAERLGPCDILKIDTEGCEREILESYTHLESVTAVLLEWHSAADYAWIRKFFRDKGWKLSFDRAHGRFLPDREMGFVNPRRASWTTQKEE
jgi:FkbM family methyltransferase